MKRTWLIIGSVVTVVVLGFSTSQAVGLLAHEEITESRSFPAAGLDRLFVDDPSGSVEVTGDPSADAVSVVAEISNGLQRTRHSAEVRDGALFLRSSCPFFSSWCSVDYHVTVPATMAVSVTSDNGRVTVRDVTGPVQVGSDNGRVELVRVTGDVIAISDNGRISASGLRSEVVVARSDNGRVELGFVVPPRSVDAEADNGSIDIVVPDTEATYAVDAHSDNGSTDIGIRSDPASDRAVHADADNGDVTVRYPAG